MELERSGVYERMDSLVDMVAKGLTQLIEDFRVKAQVKRFHSIFTLYFTDAQIENYASLLGNDAAKYGKYSKSMRDQGIILSTNHLRRCHLSTAHEGRREQVPNMRQESF